MKFNNALLFCLFVLCASSSTTFAQDSVALDAFRASETVDDAFHISRPDDIGHLKFHGQFHLDYANDPLVYEGPGDQRGASAQHQLIGNIGLAFGLFDRVVVFAGLPLAFVSTGDDVATVAGVAIPKAAGFALADLYLGARVRILGQQTDFFGLGAQISMTLPTASGDQRFVGDNSVSVHPELLAELRPEVADRALRVTINLGVRIRNNASFPGFEAGDELTWGVGATYPIFGSHLRRENRLDVHAQVYGAFSFTDFFGREESPVEGTIGAKFHHTSGIVAGLAFGTGFSNGYGSPDLRLIGMIGFGMPRGVDGDRDGDGFLDEEDSCPDVAGDAQGCPAGGGDADGDGVPDDSDLCPDDAEDADGFEDDDGCVDADNDEDGVPDTEDRCPLEAGVAENQGCVDTDGDSDSVVDRLDNCPTVAGTVEFQGCTERQLVRITAGRLEILDKVYFDTNSDNIQSRSYPLLDNVAAVLNRHDEMHHIRVEGHTDSRGDHDHNMDLSRRRAEAVVDYLVNKDVDRERLRPQGFGPDTPIDTNDTRDGRANNRRVEFNIED